MKVIERPYYILVTTCSSYTLRTYVMYVDVVSVVGNIMRPCPCPCLCLFRCRGDLSLPLHLQHRHGSLLRALELLRQIELESLSLSRIDGCQTSANVTPHAVILAQVAHRQSFAR